MILENTLEIERLKAFRDCSVSDSDYNKIDESFSKLIELLIGNDDCDPVKNVDRVFELFGSISDKRLKRYFNDQVKAEFVRHYEAITDWEQKAHDLGEFERLGGTGRRRARLIEWLIVVFDMNALSVMFD